MKRLMLLLVLASVCGLAQAQSYLNDPRYGADTATRVMVLERMNMMKDANDSKDAELATQHAFAFINVAPAASQNAYILVLNYYKMKVNLATELEERDMYVCFEGEGGQRLKSVKGRVLTADEFSAYMGLE